MRQANLGHSIQIQIREDVLKMGDSLEIPCGFRHVQRIPAVPRAFPDRNDRSQFAEGFESRMDQHWMGVDGGVRLELDQVGFEQHTFPADIQVVLRQYPAHFAVQLLVVFRLANNRNHLRAPRLWPFRNASRASGLEQSGRRSDQKLAAI
jgi:hypothetical protein